MSFKTKEGICEGGPAASLLQKILGKNKQTKKNDKMGTSETRWGMTIKTPHISIKHTRTAMKHCGGIIAVGVSRCFCVQQILEGLHG